jgi:hypothetical protein
VVKRGWVGLRQESGTHTHEYGYGHYDDEDEHGILEPLFAVFKVEAGVCEIAKKFRLAGKLLTKESTCC